jgi:hypothetical protein
MPGVVQRMEAIIKQVAQRLGIGEDKGAALATQLQDKGQDVGRLVQEPDFPQKVRGVLGDRGMEFIGHIPGIGGMLSGFFGQHSQAPATPETIPAEAPAQQQGAAPQPQAQPQVQPSQSNPAMQPGHSPGQSQNPIGQPQTDPAQPQTPHAQAQTPPAQPDQREHGGG